MHAHTLQPGAGLGLKPQHFSDALRGAAPGLWFEVHPENYLMAGGPRLAWLEAVRSRHALALHGVSLSLAGPDAPDAQHLQRLAGLAQQVQPWLVSEHLAWSRVDGRYFPDLLPVPRTTDVLQRVAANIARTKDALKCRIALENPAHYLRMDEHAWSEPDFLAELVRRTGCALLVDINNVHVSAANVGVDAQEYLAQLPAAAIAEIHLAGHSQDASLPALLVDSHDAAVAEPVWALYRSLVARVGPRPTLIERDGKLPAFEALLAERAMAQAILDEVNEGSGLNEAGELCIMSQAEEQGDYYRQFLQALFEGHTSSAQVRLLMQQPAFAVYRNTVLKGSLDALAANYPVVCKLVGQEWFDSAAMVFVRAHVPDDACLIDYGREFPVFLASFAPAQDLPYLPGVAALDRCWSESHLAADGPVLDASDLLAALSAGRDVRLVLHAATRWSWDEACPSYTIWEANRNPDTPCELAPEWQGEGALLTRPQGHVTWRAASVGTGVFLQACSDGASVAQAIGLALQREPALEMTAMLGELLLAGAFSGFE